MRITRLVLPAALLLLAGCGGSAPPPEEPEQVAVVELREPPKPVAAAKDAPEPEAAPADDAEKPAPDDAAKDEEKEEAPVGLFGVLQAGDGGGFGAGGLGLSGVGSSGLSGGGVGLGSASPGGIGGIGGLGGVGSTGQGFGSGRGRLSGATSAPPKIQMGATDIKGKLAPEVIRRIVRQNFGRFRLCYENGLRTDPKLEGKVLARFTIAGDGSVTLVADGGSTMSDKTVVACVLKAFKSLKFPEPEGKGIVIVNYPILFQPGSPAPAAPTTSSAAPPASPPPLPSGVPAAPSPP